jgi:hypothetical protein
MNFLKPVPLKGDPYDNQNVVFVTGSVKYSNGSIKTLFSQQIENVYQQVHTPPNSVLTIKTLCVLMSRWINKPLKEPLTIKNRSFKEVCIKVLGNNMGSFEIEDFVISGIFTKALDVVENFQLEGLKVLYNISYKNNKVNIVKSTSHKTIVLEPETGLKTMPLLNTSDSSYITEYISPETYYQVQFSTVTGLLSCGDSVEVTDFRGLKRKGYVSQIMRSFDSINGGG